MRRKDILDTINQFLKDHKTAGRILVALALVTQVLTAYVIIITLYEVKDEIYESFKDVLKYIFKGEIN